MGVRRGDFSCSIENEENIVPAIYCMWCLDFAFGYLLSVDMDADQRCSVICPIMDVTKALLGISGLLPRY